MNCRMSNRVYRSHWHLFLQFSAFSSEKALQFHLVLYYPWLWAAQALPSATMTRLVCPVVLLILQLT